MTKAPHGSMPSGRIILVHPIAEGGVFDYVKVLRRELEQLGTGREISHLALAEHSGPLEVGGNDIIVLQYSGYGFAKRGAPVWLVGCVAKWQAANVMVGIYFHELFASGPIWTSSFWLEPLQRYVALALAQRADFWMTNREASAHWLEGYARSKIFKTLPVCSNIDEPPEYRPETLKRRTVVVFGSPTMRRRAFPFVEAVLPRLRAAGLEVHDVGSPGEDLGLDIELRRIGVVRHGRLPSAEVSRAMMEARYGVVAYPVSYVAKSGIFAAYCAHSVCPIVLSTEYPQCDGLDPGVHYLKGLPDDDGQAEITAAAAWQWYQPHSQKKHAMGLLQLIRERASC